MKNELLARAIGEIDDDLLEEARLPFPKRERTFVMITRYAAAAACLIAVFAMVLVTMQRSADIVVSVNGTRVAARGISNEPIEIPLAAPLSPRSTPGTAITLQVSAKHGDVSITAGNGGAVALDGETAHKDLTISEVTEIIWIIDPTTGDSFELTLRSKDECVKLTATVSEGGNTLTITSALD